MGPFFFPASLGEREKKKLLSRPRVLLARMESKEREKAPIVSAFRQATRWRSRTARGPAMAVFRCKEEEEERKRGEKNNRGRLARIARTGVLPPVHGLRWTRFSWFRSLGIWPSSIRGGAIFPLGTFPATPLAGSQCKSSTPMPRRPEFSVLDQINKGTLVVTFRMHGALGRVRTLT